MLKIRQKNREDIAIFLTANLLRVLYFEKIK